MSQIALLQWPHGPWILDMGPALLCHPPDPYGHIQGGFCITLASLLPGSHSVGRQVLVLLAELGSHSLPAAREPGKMRAQMGLCLLRRGAPRYRMGAQGCSSGEEAMGEGARVPDEHRVNQWELCGHVLISWNKGIRNGTFQETGTWDLAGAGLRA